MSRRQPGLQIPTSPTRSSVREMSLNKSDPWRGPSWIRIGSVMSRHGHGPPVVSGTRVLAYMRCVT